MSINSPKVLISFTIAILFISGGFLISCNDDEDTPKVETKDMKGYFFTLEGEEEKTGSEANELITCASEDITLNITYLDKDNKDKGANVTGTSTSSGKEFLQEGFIAPTKVMGNIRSEYLVLSYVTVDKTSNSYENTGIYEMNNDREPGGKDQQIEGYVGFWSGKPNGYDYVLDIRCPYVLTTPGDNPDLDKIVEDQNVPNMTKIEECTKAFEHFKTRAICFGYDVNGKVFNVATPYAPVRPLPQS